ncbi:MAG: LamG-like jellyroll fold domain-containing protein [Roseibacillus sp.]
MNDPRFQRLLDLYLDGGLDAEELAEIERFLLSDQQARTAFWEQAHLHEALRRQTGESWGVVAAQRDRKHHRATQRWVTAAAALIIVTLTALFLVSRRSSDPDTGPTAGPPPSVLPALPAPVAVLSELAGADWDGSRMLHKGEALEPGELVLRSGMIGLTFFSGARVTVAGPARLSILSESSMQLDAGNLRVECPEVAHGFTVFTPSGQVIDLGTAFGLSVGANGTAEVQVMEGLVAMRGDAEKTDTELREQGVAVIDENGRVTLLEKATRPNSEMFAHRIRDREQQRFEKWRKDSEKRVGDEDLLIYLRMLDDANSTSLLLSNDGGSEAASSTASVIAGEWVTGRWPGKRALLFQSAEDRARVSIEGQYPKVTFAAWVRIVGFQRPFNALLMSDKKLEGGVHWQFTQAGEGHFSVRTGSPGRWKHQSAFNDDEMLPPSDNGVWRHLATCYDADERLVVHYLDGREVGRHALPKLVPLSFGRATIGNTSYASVEHWGSRQFGGAVDELAVYSRVLNPREISELYEEGRPD